MIITLAQPGEPETSEQFTLRIPPARVTNNAGDCPLCSQRPPVWFANPASTAAMDPSASPIQAPEACAPCVNALIEEGVIAVLEIDPDSF